VPTNPAHPTASQPATDAERLAVPPDKTAAPTAAAWLLDPAAPPTESANARLILQWETEPQAPEETW
jgi:hypothetical protein